MATGKEIAVVSKEIGTSVLGRITEMVEGKQLTLPSDYDAGTAVNSAMLILQDTKDRNGKPVLEVCTKASIAKSVLDMVIQGLQPGKKQGYFIAYADQLTFFRSYFGTVAALKRAMPEVDKPVSEIIYNGDEVVYGLTPLGERYVQYIASDPLANKEKGIRGGFCTIYGKDGSVLGSSIMTWNEIQTSWRQSRNYKAEGGVHQKFTEEMAKRTLIAKACKMLLNTSNEMAGNSAVVKAFNDTTDSEFDMEVQNEQKPEKKTLSFKERHGIPEKTAQSVSSEETKTDTPKVEKHADEPRHDESVKIADSPDNAQVNGPEDFEDEPFGDVPLEEEPDMFAGMDDVKF